MEPTTIIAILKYGFLSLGFIFFALGAGILIGKKRKEKACTKTVQAKIVDVKEVSTISGCVSDHEGYFVSWYPVYEYGYGGKSFTIVSSVGGMKQDFKVGEIIPIRINPNNPEKFISPKSKSKQVGLIFAGVGILLFAATGFIFFLQKKLGY